MERLQAKRIAYLDWLRVFATMAVVVMHLCSQKWYEAADSARWQVLNLFDGLARWPVPVFVMISGAVFLGGDQSVGKLWRRYIPRILAAFFFWSVLYALVSYRNGAADVWKEVLYGHYHMWYLYFICGLYMITPFLRKIAEDDRLTGYFLLLSLVFGNLLPRLADAAAQISPGAGVLASALMGKIKVYFLMGHVFYYMLGHVLHRREFSRRQRRGIYFLGILGAALTVLGTAGLSHWKGEPVQLLYDPASVHIACMAAALFVFAKYHLTALPKPVKWFSKCSFGIYLVHALVIEELERAGLHVLSANPLLTVPALAAAVLAISWAVSAALGKIPVLGKYIT